MRVSWLKFNKPWLQATIGMLKDGTIAIELDVGLALLQWPFLTDISLVWAAASVFDNTSGLGDEDPTTVAAGTAADAILRSTELSPWLYFNVVLRDSQIFLPVADPVSLWCNAIIHTFWSPAFSLLVDPTHSQHLQSFYILSTL